MRTVMQVNFLHWNVRDTVIILEQGDLPHPRCRRCDMLVPWRALNVRHLATAKCVKGVERKRRRLVEEEIRESAERDFQAYGRPFETVTSFKYLGRVLRAVDDDWAVVVGNLKKAQKIWARLMRILVWDGDNQRVSGIFQGSGTGGATFWAGDVGVDSPHGTGPGKFSTQVRMENNSETSKETGGGGLRISADGNSNGGVRL